MTSSTAIDPPHVNVWGALGGAPSRFEANHPADFKSQFRFKSSTNTAPSFAQHTTAVYPTKLTEKDRRRSRSHSFGNDQGTKDSESTTEVKSGNRVKQAVLKMVLSMFPNDLASK